MDRPIDFLRILIRNERIIFCFLIITILVISFLVFVKNLRSISLKGDEIGYLKCSVEWVKLRVEKGMTWKEIAEVTAKPFTVGWLNIDTPIIMEYLIGITMYLKYKESFLYLATVPFWNFELNRDENIKRGAEIPKEILHSVRYLSLVAGILSCIGLFLVLWTLGIRIGALISSLFLIFNRLFQIYTGVICPEVFLILFSSFSILFFLKFYNNFLDNSKYSLFFMFLTAILISFSLLTKLTAIIYILYFFLFLVALIIIKGNLKFQSKSKILFPSLVILLLTVFITFYLFHPYFRIHPISGWIKMVENRMGDMRYQRIHFSDAALSLIEKLILVPKRIVELSMVSIRLPVSGYYLFLLGESILFLIGMIKGLSRFRLIAKDKNSGNFFVLTSLWMFMVVLIIIFLHCDWVRYYLVCVYLYYIIIGIGIGEIERLVSASGVQYKK